MDKRGGPLGAPCASDLSEIVAMKRLIAGQLAVLFFLLGAHAMAAEAAVADSKRADDDTVPDPYRLDFGLRFGWAIPQAESVRGVDLADTVTGAIPLWLEVGYRLPPLVIGLYAQYGYVIVSGCATDRCHSSDIRFGVQLRWHLGDRSSSDHWIGVGTGYEILSEQVDEFEGALSGFEFINLQFGEDLALGRGFAMGPFFSASLGKFLLDSRPANVRSQAGSLTPGDDEIENASFHVWIVLGARLSFGT
jgi:hypothetical protein